MLTAEGARRIGWSTGPICRSSARVSSVASASGISCQANRGAPMSTVETCGSASFQQASNPALVSNVNARLPVSSNNNSAMQRMPLPHAPASEPSLL